MDVSITNLPVKTNDIEEILKLAVFVSAIAAGLSRRYPKRGEVTIRLWLKHPTSDTRQKLTEQGWTLAFEDGYWIASQKAQGQVE